MTVYRENRSRKGAHICHLFRNCRVLSGKPFELAEVRDDAAWVPVCHGCRTGSTVPGHPNEQVRMRR